MRTNRARRRLFRQTQTLPERGLLYRADLSIHGFPDDHVPRAVCNSANFWLDRAVAGNAARPGAKNRPASPDLSRQRRAQLYTHGPSELARLPSKPLHEGGPDCSASAFFLVHISNYLA